MLKAFVTRKSKNNKNQAKQARQVCLHESHPHFPLILLPEAFPSFGSREKWKIFKTCGKKLIPTNVIMLCVCVLRVEFLHADFGLPRRQSFCQCLIGSELFLPLTLHTSQHIAGCTCAVCLYECTARPDKEVRDVCCGENLRTCRSFGQLQEKSSRVRQQYSQQSKKKKKTSPSAFGLSGISMEQICTKHYGTLRANIFVGYRESVAGMLFLYRKIFNLQY